MLFALVKINFAALALPTSKNPSNTAVRLWVDERRRVSRRFEIWIWVAKEEEKKGKEGGRGKEKWHVWCRFM